MRVEHLRCHPHFSQATRAQTNLECKQVTFEQLKHTGLYGAGCIMENYRQAETNLTIWPVALAVQKMINYTNYTVAQRLTLSPFHNLHTTLIIAIASNTISQVNRAGKACVSEHADKRSTSGSHHDIVTLHLGLLVGQFVILHLQARAKRRKGTSIWSRWRVKWWAHLWLLLTCTQSVCHQYKNMQRLRTIRVYLWYWACRNWNSSLIRSHDSATVNLKPGCPGWWGACEHQDHFGSHNLSQSRATLPRLHPTTITKTNHTNIRH